MTEQPAFRSICPLSIKDVNFDKIKPWWYQKTLCYNRILECLREQNDGYPLPPELFGQVVQVMEDLKLNGIEVTPSEVRQS